MRTPFALVVTTSLSLALVGCPDGAATGEKCSESLKELKDLCPPGTMIKFQSEASGKCGADGKYQPMTQGAELGGTCESQGACEVACIATGLTCPCGVSKIGRDAIECREDCSPDCGNDECDSGETKQNCPGDCAPPMSSEDDPEAGSAGEGSAGKGGSGGKGGASGSAASDAGAGTAGSGGSGTGGSGSAGAACGELQVFGRHLVRDDGIVFHMPTVANGTQTPVIDAETGSPLRGVIAATEGGSHACGVLEDGGVSCWQLDALGNNYGQLGDGTTKASTTYRATRVLTGPGTALEKATGLASMAVGYGTNITRPSATCAVVEGGKLYCWGELAWLVNKGTPLSSPYAQAITLDGVEELTGVKQASVNASGACAVVAGEPNEVWCWGYSAHLELGDMMSRQYPTKILGLTNPTQVAVSIRGFGSEHANCALDEGNVRCWGTNATGEVGIAKGASVASPTLVKLTNGTTSLDAVTAIVPSIGAFCALREGKVWCWGNGYEPYAKNQGATNVVSLGDGTGPSYITSDGIYHFGNVAITPMCGKL